LVASTRSSYLETSNPAAQIELVAKVATLVKGD